MQNVVGRLWQRFEDAYRKREASLKHRVNDAGYELWIDFEGEEAGEDKYIFVGMEVAEFEDVPLEFVTRELPETRYAVYTLRGEAIKTDWPQHVLDWISAAGLEQSYTYVIEYYDWQRFKGMDAPDSELDIYVPVN